MSGAAAGVAVVLMVAVVEKPQPVTDVEVLLRSLLLHLGAAKVGRAEGRELAHGLALFLQRHDAVFLKHIQVTLSAEADIHT